MPLRFEYALCTGCKLCQLACSGFHDNVFNPARARLKIQHEYVSDGIKISSSHCIFCKKCESVCPVGAISNNGRWIIVDHDTCIGCGKCSETCPTGIIYLDENKKSIICNLCGGRPRCVEWCPKHVISLKEREGKK